MAPGQAVVKSEGGRKRLVIDYRGLAWGPDLAQYPEAMRDVIEKLRELDAEEIVLSEYYERIYDEKQTNWLRQVADLINALEADAVWSPSHLGKTTESKALSPRHDAVLKVMTLLRTDPFKAYMTLIQEIKSTSGKVASASNPEDLKVYLGTLTFMRQKMEALDLIQQMKGYLVQLGSIPEGRAAYHAFFESAIKPSFIGSRIFFTSTEDLELVDQYEVAGTNIYLYKHPDKIEYLYFINPPEYSLPPEKYFLLEKTKEVVAQHRPDSVQFMDITQARKYFRKIYVATIADLALKNNIDLSVEEKEELAGIVARYTIGYGILEILLSDRRITDVYIDSPLGVKPVYLVHSKYGQCQTNIIFSHEEARSIVSRFRALSGRPFDEAHPILDFDLEDLQTRVAVIGKPLALDGLAFALRLHKQTPWTLAQFVDAKMYDPLTAGMMSFFVDAQASMLIVGSRGSGKCLDGDSLVQLDDGQLVKIRDLVERHLQSPTVMDDGVYADCNGPRVFSLSPDLKIKPSKVSRVWRRQAPEQLYELRFASGKSIRTTPEHPFFVVEKGFVKTVRADALTAGEFVAAPRRYSIYHTPNYPIHPQRAEEWSQELGMKYFGNERAVQDDLSNLPPEVEIKDAATTMDLPYRSVLNLKWGIRKGISLDEMRKLSEFTGQPLSRYLHDIQGMQSNTSLHRMHADFLTRPLDESYARFLGLLFGDGHIDDVEVQLASVDPLLLNEFKDLGESLFGVSGRVRQPKNRCAIIQFSSKTLSRYLQKRFGLPSGKKADIQRVPAEIFTSPNEVIASFLQGYYDCDASVHLQKNEIELCTASRDAAEHVQHLLLRFGILSTRKTKSVKGKTYYRVFIRSDNTLKFQQFIGFGVESKRAKLESALKNRTFNSNVDVVPNVWDLFSHTRRQYGKGRQLDQHHIGRRKLQKLSYEFLQVNAQDDKIRQMHNLAHSDLFWDKIVSVEKVVPKEPYVYDLTVEGNHSFVANGIVAHNTSQLQSLMLEIPQNLRILVQEDSVTGDTPIVVEREGRLESTTVGVLVDSMISKYGCQETLAGQRLPMNPEFVKVFAASKDGHISLVPVSHFIRHKTNKPVYEVVTQSGRKINVTGDHSLFTYRGGNLEQIRTENLCVGDTLATAPLQLEESSGTVSAAKTLVGDSVTSVTCLGEWPDYVYDVSVPGYENFVCAEILAHNTQELPVPKMKSLGLNIQRMKTRPPLGGGTESEVSAEDALRTALRLGDSVLIVGEVRSTEARALYEAMRVGAVGNVVMGTIHGESAYSIWDRVVNDLEVPTTSFKATDFCLVSAPIRFRGSIKRHRRLIEVTEVLKNWTTDPGKEDGFLNWLNFDANKDKLDVFQDAIREKSAWLAKVKRMRGLDFDAVWSEISARGATKQYLVDQKNKFGVPKLLEAEYAVRAHNKYLLLSEAQRTELGAVDYKTLIPEWKKWVDDNLVKDLVQQSQG